MGKLVRSGGVGKVGSRRGPEHDRCAGLCAVCTAFPGAGMFLQYKVKPLHTWRV